MKDFSGHMTLHYFFLPATRVKFVIEVARATRNQLGMALFNNVHNLVWDPNYLRARHSGIQINYFSTWMKWKPFFLIYKMILFYLIYRYPWDST